MCTHDVFGTLGLFGALRRLMRTVVIVSALAVTLTGFKTVESLFVPDADIWHRWAAHDPINPVTVDFSGWERFLQTYVRPTSEGINVVHYGGVTPDDRRHLDAFLVSVSEIPVTKLRRTEQLAYWINLYNALTVRVILDHYPVVSIRDIDISPGLFSDGPWDKTLITVEGEELTLNDIEHRILRPIWRDPRIHYAVNCASIGCPNLQAHAFTGSDIDAMLDASARAYVNDPRGVSIRDGQVTVSKIYDWFDKDFGMWTEDILDHLLEYAEPALAEQLRAIGTIHKGAYDWRLNRPMERG